MERVDTSFAQLGVTDRRKTHFDISGVPLSIIRLQKGGQPKSGVYVAFFDHPLVGERLAHFQSKISPRPFFDRRQEFTADYEMPFVAAGEIPPNPNIENDLENSQRLHDIHSKDPNISESYNQLVAGNLKKIIELTKVGTYDDFYKYLDENLIAFNDASAEEHRVRFGKIIDYGYSGTVGLPAGLRHLFNSPVRQDFVEFLKQKRPFNVEKWRGDDMDPNMVELRYWYWGPYYQRTSSQEFWGGLSADVQTDLGLSFCSQIERKTLLDFEKPKVYKPETSPLEIEITSDSTAVITHSDNGLQVSIREDTEADVPSWKAIDYKFPPDYKNQAIYPVIAWERGFRGKRRFLTQKDIVPYLDEVDVEFASQSDIFMGRVLVGYFAPEITTKWPEKMSLKDGRRLQPMYPPQMPLWVSHAKNVPKLLSVRRNIFRALESPFS